MNRSSRTRRPWRRRIALRSYAIANNQSMEKTDDALGMLEDRIVSLEEILAARWWQRRGVRRRLAAELRASARRGAHAADDFRGRRVEAVTDDMLTLWQGRRRGAK